MGVESELKTVSVLDTSEREKRRRDEKGEWKKREDISFL